MTSALLPTERERETTRTNNKWERWLPFLN
jgi:hypothetical protein